MSFFYLLLALQGFCLYHAYRSRTDQKWYWIIIFFPYIGCALYLYDAFYSRRTVSAIKEGFKEVVNSSYRLEQLEKQARFSGSAKNRIELADEYIRYNRFADAVAMYEECRVGYLADDEPLKRKLVHALYLNEQFDRCIEIGRELNGSKDFRNAPEHISLAWALHKAGYADEALEHFRNMDRSYTNYPHRCAFCRFLMTTGKADEAKEKLTEMSDEIEHMTSTERRANRDAMRMVGELRREIGS